MGDIVVEVVSYEHDYKKTLVREIAMLSLFLVLVMKGVFRYREYEMVSY